MGLHLLTNTEPSDLPARRLVSIGKLAGEQYLLETLDGCRQMVAVSRITGYTIESVVEAGGVVAVAWVKPTTRVKPGERVMDSELQWAGYGELLPVDAFPAR